MRRLEVLFATPLVFSTIALLWLVPDRPLGLAPYCALALLAVALSPSFRAAGIAAYALWDIGHFGRAAFVPDWYVAGCVIVDLALGLHAAGQVRYWRRQPPESRQKVE